MIKWVCDANKGRKSHCAERSIRADSYCSQNRLGSLAKFIQVLYMWSRDFDNRFIVRELKLEANTVVDWCSYARQEVSE